MRHAAQLLCLPIGLGRNAAEYDLIAIVVADLGDKNLEGPPLVAANRFARCLFVTVSGQMRSAVSAGPRFAMGS